MQGAQNLRSEAYLLVRCNDEGEAQRRRWTFYETINPGSVLIQADAQNRILHLGKAARGSNRSRFFRFSLRDEVRAFYNIVYMLHIGHVIHPAIHGYGSFPFGVGRIKGILNFMGHLQFGLGGFEPFIDRFDPAWVDDDASQIAHQAGMAAGL